MRAMMGDLIRVVMKDEYPTNQNFKNGDILEVAIAVDNGDVYIDNNGLTPIWLVKEEYEVLTKHEANEITLNEIKSRIVRGRDGWNNYMNVSIEEMDWLVKKVEEMEGNSEE